MSSNCYIGHSYAFAILGFLRDYWKGKESSEPVYIVEAGAGSAKLSYVLIKHLTSWRKFWPHEGCFKYIVTDFSATNFEFWMNHSSLQHLTEAGLLDFSVFDPENTEVLKLELSGLELTLSQHPIILVANYVFDSLKQDAFQVIDGDLYEMLCTTTIPSNLDPTGVDLAKYVECSWNVNKVVGDFVNGKGYYPDKPHWNQVLSMIINMGAPIQSLSDAGLIDNASMSQREEGSSRDGKDKEEKDEEKQESSFREPEEGQKTQNEVEQTNLSIIMPVGAFYLLDKLRCLSSGGRLVVLAGDKGITSPSQMIGYREPHIALHGSFSCMVNFMALYNYCEVEGGWAKFSQSLEGFKCCVMMLGMGGEGECKSYLRFRKALDNILGIFGPDGFSTLQVCMYTFYSVQILIFVMMCSNCDVALTPDLTLSFNSFIPLHTTCAHGCLH